MKTAREIYIENMQRDNAIVASELSKYLDTLGVKYKMESSVYIGIKICNFKYWQNLFSPLVYSTCKTILGDFALKR